MREELRHLKRFIATPMVSKHRVFVWLPHSILPDQKLVVFPRDDDTSFGLLHSRQHQIWSLANCSWIGVGNDPTYATGVTFETFPFPTGLTPNIPAKEYKNDLRAKAIAAAAARLDELREAWLNPEDLVKREPEVVPGFPDRILPRNEKAAAELKKRTLTNLYNTRPQWLADAHAALDRAVAAAYGWPHDLTDDEILARLLALNLERAAAQDKAAASAPARAARGKSPGT
jgi:type II restriction/modification system DNA methylase subunit YeeA